MFLKPYEANSNTFNLKQCVSNKSVENINLNRSCTTEEKRTKLLFSKKLEFSQMLILKENFFHQNLIKSLKKICKHFREKKVKRILKSNTF